MNQTIQEFLETWASEARNTSTLLPLIPDEILHKKLIPNQRTIAQLIWHILEIPKALLDQAKIRVEGPSFGSAPPKTIDQIIEDHGKLVASVLKNVHAQWDDASLDKTEKVFGNQWRRRDILLAILLHLIHFRGELTTLVRLGGVDVPSIYEIDTSKR